MPSNSVISPRFYVLQSDKCRPIDDFTFNLLNSAVGSANKVVLHDTDFIAALLKRCCSYNKVPWRGRAFDLQDAYRQLAIAPAHRTHSFICVYEPMHGPRCYRMLTMPFGSSASVYAFLRTSLAIHALGARLFRLPWTCFYDDFPTVVPEPLANAATHLIKSLFTLLGFQVSDKPSKNPPFAAVFQALGVAFNLHASSFWGFRSGEHRGPNPSPVFQLARAFDKPFPLTQGGSQIERPHAVCARSIIWTIPFTMPLIST